MIFVMSLGVFSCGVEWGEVCWLGVGMIGENFILPFGGMFSVTYTCGVHRKSGVNEGADVVDLLFERSVQLKFPFDLLA